ncbi:MAG: hypothetical protein ACSLFC_03780 [Desulfuromonadales bacterium]
MPATAVYRWSYLCGLIKTVLREGGALLVCCPQLYQDVNQGQI